MDKLIGRLIGKKAQRLELLTKESATRTDWWRTENGKTFRRSIHATEILCKWLETPRTPHDFPHFCSNTILDTFPPGAPSRAHESPTLPPKKLQPRETLRWLGLIFIFTLPIYFSSCLYWCSHGFYLACRLHWKRYDILHADCRSCHSTLT